MPYSGASDKSLPDYIKSLPSNKRSQWVEVFNSCIARGDSEGDAFKKANGVVRKSLVEWVKSLFTTNNDEPTMRFMNLNGQTRFFTTFSNCFKDAHSEIISSEAHENYVQWVNESKQYPQLWLWHAGPKSKWGQVDFIDYVDGFVVASGLVDQDKTYIAEALSKENVKVSHGFYGLMSAKSGVFSRYRTFEISPLPANMAANSWTTFYLQEQVGDGMPFSEERRKWLIEKANLSNEQVTEWENSLSSLGTALKEAGLEWKSADYDEIISVTSALNSVLEQVTAIKAMQAEQATVIAEFKTKLGEFDTKVTEATKSLDTRVAEAFTPVITTANTGYKASESKTNIVEGEKAKEDLQWFETIISSVLR